MAFTITEKILARAAGVGSCRAGDELNVKPDFVLGYDFPGYSEVFFQQMEEDFGITRLKEPHRYAFFIDHMVPAVTVAEEELHRTTRAWGARHQVAVHERKGIGHQVAAELGYATPGAFVLHFDGHISQLGAFGTLALGVRRHILEAMVKERIAIKVPETVRIDLTGTLPPGVMARDVFHHVVRILGAGSCRFKVVEFGGDAVAQWSVESRQTLCSLAMFTGAITAIINPDHSADEPTRCRDLPSQALSVEGEAFQVMLGENNIFSGIMRTASANFIADPPDRACIESAIALRTYGPDVGFPGLDQHPRP